MKRKYFNFQIDTYLLENDKNGNLISKMLSGIVVLRAEHNFCSRKIEYSAYHEDAPEVPEGGMLPDASFEVSEFDDRISWQWRVKDIEFGKGFILKEHLRMAV